MSLVKAEQRTDILSARFRDGLERVEYSVNGKRLRLEHCRLLAP